MLSVLGDGLFQELRGLGEDGINFVILLPIEIVVEEFLFGVG